MITVKIEGASVHQTLPMAKKLFIIVCYCYKPILSKCINYNIPSTFNENLTVLFFWTFFFTAYTIPALFARLRTIRSFPASRANTISCVWVARTIVHAVALWMTILAIKTLWAFCLTSDSYVLTLQSIAYCEQYPRIDPWWWWRWRWWRWWWWWERTFGG